MGLPRSAAWRTPGAQHRQPEPWCAPAAAAPLALFGKTGNGRGPDADRTIGFKRNIRGPDADSVVFSLVDDVLDVQRLVHVRLELRVHVRVVELRLQQRAHGQRDAPDALPKAAVSAPPHPLPPSGRQGAG
eukprot:gene25686-biopygen19509